MFLVQGIILYLLYDIDFILLPTSIPVLLLVALVYYTLFETSPLKATPGKLLCRLAVVDRNGGRLTLATSLRRSFYKVFSLSGVFAAMRLILLVDSKVSIRSRWNCIVDVLSRPPWEEWSKTLVVDKKQRNHASDIDTYSTRINNLTIAQLHSIHTGFVRSIIGILVADIVIVYFTTPTMMFVFCPLVALLAIAPIAFYWRQVNVRKTQLLAARRMAALETSFPASANSQFD
ncbi:MAG: RDD family protein [Candidatus Obscuribacterales bacterium]|nr:RDD family protein [Candidatus Obscuribacterales bacterium]